MAADKISELVDQAAFAQLDKLIQKVEGAQAALLAAVDTATQFNNALGRSASTRDFVDNQTRAAQALGGVNERVRQVQRTEAQLEEARQRAEQAQQRRDQASAARSDREQARIRETIRPYQLLRVALEEARNAAGDIGAVFGTNDQRFIDATRRVQDLQRQFAAINTPLGRFRDNVGNYASGFNGLGNSINQITREFPAFSNSVQTGFLAISNNLPIFFDEIQRTRRQIAALRAEGQQVPGLFAQLTTSIVSWGTALSLGVTLLTLYGKDIVNFVGELFTGKQGIDVFADRLKNLNDVYKQSSREAGDQVSKLRILYAAATDVTNSTESRLKATQALQKEFPSVFSNISKEAILNGDAKISYDKLSSSILDNAKAKAAASKISDLVERQFEAEFQKEKIRNARLNELRRNRTEETSFASAFNFNTNKINKRASDAIAEQDRIIKDAQRQIDFFTKLGGGNNALADAIAGTGDKPQQQSDLNDRISAINRLIKLQEEANKRVQDNESSSYETRNKATIDFQNKTIELIKKRTALELDAENLTAQGKVNIVNNGRDEENRIRQEADEQQLKTQSDVNAKYAKQQEELYKLLTSQERNAIQAQEAIQAERLSAIDALRNDEATILKARYDNGEIGAEEYNKRLIEIDKKAAKSRLDLQLETVKKLIEIQSANLALGIGDPKDLQSSIDKLNKLNEEISKLTNPKQDTGGEKDAAKARQELLDIEIDFGRQSLETARAVADGIYQARIQSLEKQKAAIDEQAAYEKEQAQRSIGTSRQKEKQQAIIDQNAANRKKLLDEEIAKQRRRAAISEKVAALASIAINTAIAVTKVTAQTGIGAILAVPLVIASGALQAAAVLAQPLPEFAKGGTTKGGKLIWGEKGTELAVQPDGSTYLSPNKATVTEMPAGTRIFNNTETMRMMAKPERMQHVGAVTIDMDKVVGAVRETTAAVRGLVQRGSSARGVVRSGLSNDYLRRNKI